MSIYRGSGGAGTTADTAALDEVTTNAQEADQSATEAAASASSAAASANAASTSASNAGTSETNAASSATAAATSATQSATSATASAASATAAAASESVTAANAAAALASEQAAAASESAAATSETNAQTAQTAAETAQAAAETAQAATENLFDQFGDQYLGSKATDPTTDNDGDPLTEGDVYWNSTDNVLKFYSGTAWVAPEDIATTAATNASNSATAAASSASSASSSATAASTSETNAAASETAAATSATNAAASESAAATSESNASGSATAASNSASAASTSASQASTSASNAATSETNAANSASSASTSASAAAVSATSAAQSAASAATLLDNFDDRYLGAKASDPTVDNDGDPLVIGALYFNSTDGVMKTYTASGWLAASSASVATMAKFKFTATAGQTVFTGTDDGGDTLSMTVGSEIVTLNGIVLEAGTDYTPASGSVTLATGATADDELNVYAFGNFQVADTVSKSLGGTFTGAVTMGGGLDVTGTATMDGLTVDGNGVISDTNAGATGGYLWLKNLDATTDSKTALLFTNTTNSTFESGRIELNRTASGQEFNFYGNGNKNLTVANNGDISFYEDTGTTAKFFWDASAENLRVGDASGDYVKIDYNVDTPRISFGQGGTWAAEISHRGASSPARQNVTELVSKTDPLAFLVGSAERMRIDSAGRVTMPYQPHWAGSIGHSSGVGADGNANEAHTRNSTGTLTWGGDRITVPVAGVYAITFQTICKNTSGRRDSHLKINGTTWNSCLSEDNGSGFHQRTHTASIYLNVNDYIQFYNTSWYNRSSSGEVWQTASVTLLG